MRFELRVSDVLILFMSADKRFDHQRDFTLSSLHNARKDKKGVSSNWNTLIKTLQGLFGRVVIYDI